MDKCKILDSKHSKRFVRSMFSSFAMAAGVGSAKAEDLSARFTNSTAVLNKLSLAHDIRSERIAGADCVALIPGLAAPYYRMARRASARRLEVLRSARPRSVVGPLRTALSCARRKPDSDRNWIVIGPFDLRMYVCGCNLYRARHESPIDCGGARRKSNALRSYVARGSRVRFQNQGFQFHAPHIRVTHRNSDRQPIHTVLAARRHLMEANQCKGPLCSSTSSTRKSESPSPVPSMAAAA
jgi:hypothetical protein